MRAILSVSDKARIADFARGLQELVLRYSAPVGRRNRWRLPE